MTSNPRLSPRASRRALLRGQPRSLASAAAAPQRRSSAAALTAFVVTSALIVAIVGAPDQRDVVAAWLLGGLLAFSATNAGRPARAAIVELVTLAGLLVAYDYLRGDAKNLFATHYLPQIRIDEALFHGSDPTLALQHALWRGHPSWYDFALAGIYLTHFVAAPIIGVRLRTRDRARFRRFLATIVALSAFGLVTYAVYPAAPPWLASARGLLAHVTRIMPAVWRSLDIRFADPLVDSSYHYANNVAAVPSLHTAFAVVVAAAAWPRRRMWLRPLLVVYPAAMGFALVYSGEHYVFDVLLGVLYAAGSILLVRAAEATRERRERRRVGVPT